MTATEGTTTKVTLYGDAPARTVTLDEDMQIVLRLTNTNKQRIKVVTTDTNGNKVVKDYSLKGLTLETA